MTGRDSGRSRAGRRLGMLFNTTHEGIYGPIDGILRICPLPAMPDDVVLPETSTSIHPTNTKHGPPCRTPSHPIEGSEIGGVRSPRNRNPGSIDCRCRTGSVPVPLLPGPILQLISFQFFIAPRILRCPSTILQGRTTHPARFRSTTPLPMCP